MHKSNNRKETIITVRTGTREEFFVRGKELAKKLDKREKVFSTRIITFEDPEELANFLTKAKLALLAAIRKKSDSISELARKLHRSRAAVDKDVRLLEAVGIVESGYITNPGHGHLRVVKAVDSKPIKLHVEALI